MGKYDYSIPTSFHHNCENVPVSNYLSTHFFGKSSYDIQPSPTFSYASTSSSISNCHTHMPDINIETNKDFEHL